MSYEKQVRVFHEKFEHPVATTPQPITGALAELRVRLIAEELCEYAAAVGVSLLCTVTPHPADPLLAPSSCSTRFDPEAATSLVEAADALGDINYVVAGANVVHGFPAEAVFAEIQASNMSKLGADGLPIKRADGKILKGPNYFKPDIAKVLAVHANSAEA